MRIVVSAIRNAVKKDCLLPALVCALTIPDAMGQCLYPDLKLENGKRAAGKQYAKWFDDWAASRFLFPDDPAEEDSALPNQIFTGQMCWNLRCSLLHSGDYDVPIEAPGQDGEYDYDYRFELVLHGCNALCSSWPLPKDGERVTKSVIFRVDVATLALALCDAADACMKRGGGAIDYPELEVFDLAAWSNRMREIQQGGSFLAGS